MPLTLTAQPEPGARLIHCVRKGQLETSGLTEAQVGFARSSGFDADEGAFLLVPGVAGNAEAVFGLGSGETPECLGTLSGKLPAGAWAFAARSHPDTAQALCLALGGYAFTRYVAKTSDSVSIALGDEALLAETRRVADAVFLTRDLVNTPTNDMGPEALEQAARTLAAAFGAQVDVVSGDDLLDRNFPLIHAVGRASAEAPRLIDITWGRVGAKTVTLVGKGVCFDTGGLDIKPASNMLLMKKDMGGAAHVLGLAAMIMAAGHDVRLRVLIPAVENAIAGNAFRPGDILPSRKGLSVEIGNTDAEGRLVLADALALACEDKPDLLIDMATLTGAARVALGPDLPPFFTDDETLAEDLQTAARDARDPVWRLPLHAPYRKLMASRIADINNAGKGAGMAGAITAALFLKDFVAPGTSWVHFDIYAWTQSPKPTCPEGGEAQAIRALDLLIARRCGA